MYEYKILSGNSTVVLEKEINALALAGWDLDKLSVSAGEEWTWHTLIMRRLKIAEPASMRDEVAGWYRTVEKVHE